MLIVLAGILAVLFWFSFVPGQIVASNDGPLGQQVAACHRLPGLFLGAWNDLNSIGLNEGSAFPGLTYGLAWLLGPVGFAKFFAPLSILFLGLAAWCFFRQLGLARPAAIIGGLAMALNSGFFSDACWGTASHLCALGMNLLALAALADASAPRRWLRVALAGMAVGAGVLDGADIGVLLSFLVASYGLYQGFTWGGSKWGSGGLAVGRVALVTGCALFLAFQAVSVLIATQIQGTSIQEDTSSPERKWAFATQWSLPKKEALSLAVPGLFGYRVDTPKDMAFFKEAYAAGAYWGAVGSDLSWDTYFSSGKRIPPHGTPRFTGGSNYAGIAVDLVALWAIAQGLRRKGSVFSPQNRQWIWFWTVLGGASLLIAFGRFAPFYSLIFHLPFFSSIRNPAKFLIFVDLSLAVLCAYGVDGLWRRYLEPEPDHTGKLATGRRGFWRRAEPFERRWVMSCIALCGASVLGYLIYASSRESLVGYLQEVSFDQETAQAIASFSVSQVRWFLLFLGAAVCLLLAMTAGGFRGTRGRLGAVLLGILVVADLGRANLPWIIRWDIHEKYSSNPIIDWLRQQPYEHRVALLPFIPPPQFAALNYLYNLEWLQHLFPYYDVQSLDIIQMPRGRADLDLFEKALKFDGTSNTLHHVARRWQLANTRYLLGPAGFLEVLNEQLDPIRHRFQIRQRFAIAPKADVIFDATNPETWTATLQPNGDYAVFEFTGVLPRASLYSGWQISTNDSDTLQRLASPEFDPENTLWVAPGAPAPSGSTAGHSPGTVEFLDYAPKRIALRTDSASAAILLLNDKYDPWWNAGIDGKPAKLLRCNFIMRGVYLPKGRHQVEFRFQPPLAPLYVTLSGLGAALLLCGALLLPGDSITVPQKDLPVTPGPRP